MIRCPNCNHGEFPGSLFCSECGANMQADKRSRKKGEPITKVIPREARRKPATGKRRKKMPPDMESAPPDSIVSLHIVDAGKTVPLIGEKEFTLGRVSQGQPLIPEVDLSPYSAYEQGVSRLHAVIGVYDVKIIITDLGSANGTRVNGVRISPHTPHPLENGDMVTLGKLKIQTFIRRNG